MAEGVPGFPVQERGRIASGVAARHKPGGLTGAAMDAFSYLSVLLSIVLGLALQQVLQGYRGLLLNRGRVKLHAPTLIWSALMILIVAQNWWASFDLGTRSEWNFQTFAVILLQVMLMYMMAAVVLPDIPPDADIDLAAHYARERPWFFGLFGATIATSALRDMMLDGHLPDGGNGAFHIVFAAVALAGMTIRSPRFHAVLAPAMAAVVGAYVVLLFARLA